MPDAFDALAVCPVCRCPTRRSDITVGSVTGRSASCEACCWAVHEEINPETAADSVGPWVEQGGLTDERLGRFVRSLPILLEVLRGQAPTPDGSPSAIARELEFGRAVRYALRFTIEELERGD